MNEHGVLLRHDTFDIAITGCGWIGLPLAESFAAKGLHVLGTTTRSERLDSIRDAGCEAVQWSVSPEKLSTVPWRAARVLVVTLPPRAGWGQAGNEAVHRHLSAIAESTVEHVVLCSSTSVYPREDGTYREKDARIIESSHTGIAVLPIEQIYYDNDVRVTVLRFGGLFGAGRDPAAFVRNKKVLSRSEAPVNFVHRDDATESIRFGIEEGLDGTFNVVAPEHPTRGEFYRAAGVDLEGDSVSSPGCLVSSAAIMQQGFRFRYADPVDGLQAL